MGPRAEKARLCVQALLRPDQPNDRQFQTNRPSLRVYRAGLSAPTRRYLQVGNRSMAAEARIRPASPRAMPASVPRHVFPRRSAALVTASPMGIITLATASPSAAAVGSSPRIPLGHIQDRSGDDESVGDMVHLDSESLLVGSHAEGPPSRNSTLTPYERAVLSGESPPEDPKNKFRKGVKGWAKISETQNRNPKSIREHVRYWNIFVKIFCDPEGYDPWQMCPTIFELFAGHMFELETVRSIDKFGSAINYVHRAHGLVGVVRGGRYMEAKQAFKNAVLASGRLVCTYRALIPDFGYVNFLGRLAGIEARRDWIQCDRAFLCIAKQLSWVRAVTMGASEPGDFRLMPQGTDARGKMTYSYAFTIRKTKCGNEAFRPTVQVIPWPALSSNNGVAEVVMGFVARTLLRNPKICAESLGITQTSAAGIITGWMREFMPIGELLLPEGAMISSHSARDTGATHAKRSVYPPCDWDTVMSWGGWLSQKRCRGYVKSLTGPSAFWRQFYYWLAPNFHADVTFPRPGWAEED